MHEPLFAFQATIPSADSQIDPEAFAVALEETCEGKSWNDACTLSGDRNTAVIVFLEIVRMTLTAWSECNHDLGTWLRDHPELYRAIQKAQLRIRVVFTANIEVKGWLIEENIPLGDGTSSGAQKIVGVRTWKQAAETAALCLFGEYLLNYRDKVSFCEKCGSAFTPRIGKQFCKSKCSHNSSSIRAHRLKTRSNNARRLSAASQALIQWLAGPRRKPWRDQTERAARLGTRDGRRSRWLTEFIRVALQRTNREDGLVRLTDLCFDGRPYSDSPMRLKSERRLAESTIQQFLANIVKAEER
jgi:hypothetical protein